MENRFDVVVVPDFTGAKPFTFELRTLFFLASWWEYSGAARSLPLHLACIGEPPTSVKWLAQKCNAQITVHQPIEAEKRGTANKLRGFEVEAQTERLLLLDADVLVLGDISELAKMGSSVSAAVENTARVAEYDWERIYPALGLKLPEEKILSVRQEIGLPLHRNATIDTQMEPMYPYYNSGIIFVNRGLNIRQSWEQNIRQIINFCSQDLHPSLSLTASDQAGFAITIEQFKRDGILFKRLPHVHHGNWLHLYRRTATLSETKLFHAFGIFYNAEMSRIDLDYNLLRRRLREEWRLNDRRSLSALFKYLIPAFIDAHRLSSILRKLYKLHVRESLSHN